MDDFKKLTEQLLKIYINAGSVNNLGIENYFDENISLIGTGKHELFTNLHEFLESFKFDVKRRGKIRLEVRNLHQEEERLDGDHVLAHGTVDFTGLFKDGSICFEMETRFTIIYKWTNGKWLVQHLHHSTPDLEQMDGEEFPLTLGKQIKKTRQALHALGTAYYHISRLNLKTKKIELVKRSREMDMGIKENTADWDPQFKIIEDIIAEPFVQKYMEFFDIQTMAARLHNKESMSSEFKKKDGSWFLSMVVPQSYDKNGNVTSVLFANRDVTDEKLRELKQEEELREAKLKAECANKAKSSFLLNMSHDIRIPMNAIIGYAELASRHLQETDKLGRYLEEIQICGKELLSMLGNVLDLARIENEIKTMPNYFDEYDTTVHFISEEELKRDHSGIPHGGFVIRTGKTGWNDENSHVIEYSLKLDSNPEFTSSVIVAYARAAYRMNQEGQKGCKTVFDVAPAYLSALSGEELRKHLL